MKDVHRIEVGINQVDSIKNAIITDLGITEVEKVLSIKVYSLEGGELSPQHLDFLAKEVFSDPIIEKYTIDSPLANPFEGTIVEIGYKPGVTDNIGRTSKEAIRDAINKDLEGVYYSQQYLFFGVKPEIAEIIVKDLLANELIERWTIKNGGTYSGFFPSVPKVKLQTVPVVEDINVMVSDEELLEISKSRLLALNLEEMKAIQLHYTERSKERQKKGLPLNPTDIELECIAQTWSEHCKHKIFNALIEYQESDRKEIIDSIFKTYIQNSTKEINSPYLVSVFKDNAGVIQFDNDHIFCMKVETHNSPTALDPYGGALTGIVGCNRDPAGTGKGFQLIFNTDVFCFASPFFNGEIPPRLFHPRRVLKGVHKGIIDGGNQSGIPTINGSLYFDERYLGKPLVFCGTGGIAPTTIANKPVHEKAPKPGDLAIMVGGRIGADGIHGATFSSLEINENSPSTAVQIGSPIVQKKMLDFLLEARDLDLLNAITDNGAGGLSSSFGEMGSTTGVQLDLEKAPLKYSGLLPWEILLSEAQERMSLAVDPENLDMLIELSKKHDVELTVIGKFTTTKSFQFFYENKLIGEILMEFLHEGVPQKKMKGVWKPIQRKEPEIPPVDNYNVLLKILLSRLNICSKEEIVRRYDHEVQARTVVKPFMGVMNDGPSDAAIIKPIYDSWEGLSVSHGLCPRYSDIDTYAMAANAIDEAVRNAVCVGADPNYLAGLDNFCWAMGFTEEEEVRYTGLLVRANKALFDITTTYKVPCISGKDSMRNDYRIGDTAVSVPPTLMFSVIGKVPDVKHVVTLDAKTEGDLVYVLGTTKNELGGSEYFDELGYIGTIVPQVEPKSAIIRYRALFNAIQEGLIASAHDCSDGGLGVALAESSLSGGLGMHIDLKKVPRENIHRDDYLLFSESASRIVVSISPKNKEKFEKIMEGTEIAQIGVIKGPNFVVQGMEGGIIINSPLSLLKKAWQSTFQFLSWRK
ncbi:MAG: phosphoribosylformylglycinamidine synthase [Candidatus Lokiarchaeota archaeon]|nr:phosphoribosylformylglycinamidine synthase [Candidatus Lokiarchaeota archaeon]